MKNIEQAAEPLSAISRNAPHPGGLLGQESLASIEARQAAEAEKQAQAQKAWLSQFEI